MATAVRRPHARLEPVPSTPPEAPPEPIAEAAPHVEPEETLGVDRLGLWIWLGGAAILVLLQVAGLIGSAFAAWK